MFRVRLGIGIYEFFGENLEWTFEKFVITVAHIFLTGKRLGFGPYEKLI